MADNEIKEVETKKESKICVFVNKHGKKKCIIVGSCVVAGIALIIGLSVGLTVGKKGPVETVTGSTPVLSADKKTCTYGIYPQTYVSDAGTISALNGLNETESNGWYLYNGYYYAKTNAKLYNTEWIYKFSDGTKIVNGETYWFRCDLIQWNVIKSGDDSYMLLSSYLLKNQVFSSKTEATGVTYKTSDVRTWLNADFYNSVFADDSYIKTTEIDNSAETTDKSPNKFACENTQDKVYLLSYKDYLNADYGFDTSTDRSTTRAFKATDYAIACGAYCTANLTDEGFSPESYVLTRSISDTYRSSCYAIWLYETGEFEDHYLSWSDTRACVQPVINISMNK